MGRNTRQDVKVELVDVGKQPTVEGMITYTGGVFRLRDAAGAYDPRAAGTGVSEATHDDLDSLAHDVVEDYYSEVTRTDGRITARTIWTDASKSTKVREYLTPRTDGRVVSYTCNQYDASGTLKSSFTQTITRRGGRIISDVGVRT